ncbi:13545_t:CDS:2 [Entrophospora sp. SA101]|nr:13545_t:CDS:2 [Entrophospora sp. SA101]CAJ0913166.1 6188_t:CDS:2 [Entrophospora sp. SA101]
MSDLSDEEMYEDSQESELEGDDDIEDEYVDEDEVDLNFSEVVPEKERKKSYQVEFKVHSIENIVKNQEDEISHVSNILGIQKQHAATLLRHFRWNKERLIERYMEEEKAVLKSAGVITDINKAPKFMRSRSFTCDVCCNDDDLNTIALSCDHRFCKDCYEHYLTQKIKEEGESRRISCMANKCNVIVDETTVAKYRTLLNRTYVDDSESLRWCPAPSCEYAVECHVPQTSLTSIVPTVECACCNRFCFGCGLPDHQPSICMLVKKWIKKCEDDSETANWISAHTKECGKCQSTIEKNGGCNHMTCRKCKYEFCWVCMGPWSEHGTSWYNCNRYDEKNSVDARDSQAKSRSSLERYLHYYNRFANHEQSAKLDRELYNKTEKKMEEMQQTSDLSWIEVQFLKKAVDILVQCRMTLKWTYAFAFYLIRNNETEIFEDNQRDLEVAVEQLSELLEKPIEPDKIGELKQQVLNKTVYVGSRREVLLADTAQGLLDSRWEFQVDIQN